MNTASARLVDEVQMAARDGDALLVVWGAETDERPGYVIEVGNGFACRGLSQRRVWRELCHTCVCLDMAESSVYPDRLNEVGGLDRIVSEGQDALSGGGGRDGDGDLGPETGDGREGCAIVAGSDTGGAVGARVVAHTGQDNHLTVQVVKGTEAEVTVAFATTVMEVTVGFPFSSGRL